MGRVLVDTKDAAKLLCLSNGRMRHLASVDKIEAEKIGNAWAFDVDDLKKYRKAKG